MRNIQKWKIHQDRDKEDAELESYTITLNEEYPGWRTDSGYEGYGLPKELAEWICEILNRHGEYCPYEMIDRKWEKVKWHCN